MLAALGAQALGTTSAGFAFTLGLPDGARITRDQHMAHAAALVAATPLPVSGDLENGYGPSPEDVAETVRLAGEAGLAGCSIEDIDLPSSDAYPADLALERVKAGVAAARGLGRDFVFLARADGVMTGAYDLDEGIRRIQAFEAAGADCVYIPVLKDIEDLKRVCASVDVPVNALAVGRLGRAGRAALAEAGAARISLGAALARATHRVIADAAEAMFERGDFSTLGGAPDVDALLLKGAR